MIIFIIFLFLYILYQIRQDIFYQHSSGQFAHAQTFSCVGVVGCVLQSFRQVTGSHILLVQIYLRAYSTRAHSWRRQRDSHYIFTHLLCSIPMPYTSVGLEYRFSTYFGRTKQKKGDELRTLRSLRTSQTDPSKIDRAYGTCVNFFSPVADPTKFFPLKVAR